mgnify:CR=1 FL=1
MKHRREWRGWRVELANLMLPKGWHVRRARLALRPAVVPPPDVPDEPLPLAGKRLILTGQITEEGDPLAAELANLMLPKAGMVPPPVVEP